MSIYSNDNISKIANLTTRELPHLAKTAKIMAYTVSLIEIHDWKLIPNFNLKLGIILVEILYQGWPQSQSDQNSSHVADPQKNCTYAWNKHQQKRWLMLTWSHPVPSVDSSLSVPSSVSEQTETPWVLGNGKIQENSSLFCIYLLVYTYPLINSTGLKRISLQR